MRVPSAWVLIGIVFVVLGLTTALVKFQSADAPPRDRAWDRMREHPAHVDHSNFFTEPFEDGPAVTRACLECHEAEARDFMQTSHWTWTGDELLPHGGGEPIAIGKKNLLNNFCVGVESNWAACTTCHAGYGWEDADFDFDDPSRVDCLVCHDGSGTYRKGSGQAGRPAEEVDLLAVARSVGRVSRTNCGYCHFNGGGGNAVKHGDLDQTMYFPTEEIDAHMGRHDFVCTDCHPANDHEIPGRSMSVSVNDTQRVRCIDCHAEEPHENDRLNGHVATVACQSCHIPVMAVREPTKMTWDWSTAGQDLPIDDPHLYLKIKGSFTYELQAEPEYYWYDGGTDRYLKGDPIDPKTVTELNRPHGDISDPAAKIWPFKVHRGKQIYDTEYLHFLVPKTYGPGGYWSEFDWDQAARLGAETSGVPYSGSYGFAETRMYWPLSHMVATRDRALQCTNCHGSGGRIDWTALGFEGDPVERGGRARTGLVRPPRDRTP